MYYLHTENARYEGRVFWAFLHRLSFLWPIQLRVHVSFNSSTHVPTPSIFHLWMTEWQAPPSGDYIRMRSTWVQIALRSGVYDSTESQLYAETEELHSSSVVLLLLSVHSFIKFFLSLTYLYCVFVSCLGLSASVLFLSSVSYSATAERNRPFSNSHGWTGSSMKWRLMRANLFKCKLICPH